jgi:uncharacterized protein (TIGR02145 family)
MAQNLNYAYVVDSLQMEYMCGSFSGRYDVVSEEISACDLYGKIYSYTAAMDSAAVFSDDGKGCRPMWCVPNKQVRGICPEGWLLPSVAEGEELVVAVDKGAHKGTALMDSVLWNGKISTDPYGFGGRPSGKRLADGTYNWLGVDGSFWLSTESKHRTTYQARIFNYNDEWNGAMGLETDKNRGLAVRCLKD